MLGSRARTFTTIVAICFTAACDVSTSTTESTSPTQALEVATAPITTSTPSGVWETLLQSTPYPHLLPLPEAAAGPLDGTFAKIDTSPPQWWTCYRCADYRPMGGIWRMQFDQGVMRIFYEVTNWKSIASFTVEGNRLQIFNDPFCPQDVGEYEWSLDGSELTFVAIEDGCAFDLRKENMVKQTWILCSNTQPAEGCIDPPDAPLGVAPQQDKFTVNVIGGDSHYFKKKPELFAAANPDNVAPPDGILVQFDEQSIPYGTHRVLWRGGDWVEATTSLPYSSIGVQLWGSGYLGWARVLFDGEEVWRGLSTSMGKKYAYYGGYIEISGFEPGEHTIRVESLAFDYHPVKVAAFGFSNQPIGK